jgi:hypothetical protein
MMLRGLLNFINNVTNIKGTESHEAALCTKFNYQRLQQTVHRVALSSVVY